MFEKYNKELILIGSKIKKGEADSSILNELFLIIEKLLIDDDLLIYNAFLNNLELFTYNFKNKKEIDKNELFYTINLLQKICSIYFMNNSNVYKYYIYGEVNEIINYYITILNKQEMFNDINKKYSIKDAEYHTNIQLIKYGFSTIDKIMNLTNHIVNLHNTKTDDFKDYKILKDFTKISEKIIKNDNYKKRLSNKFSLLDKNNFFHYLRKLRNSLEHNFINPDIKKNYIIDTNLLLILVFYIYSNIIISLKKDDEIFEIVNKIK